MSIRNRLLRSYFSRRMKAIDRFRRYPLEVQAEVFRRLMARGGRTDFGRRYGIRPGLSPEAFASQVGVQDYETFKPYIFRMLRGERNVAWPGRVELFARSSGTTSDRSKYLPVTGESLWRNHTLGMRDVAAIYAAARPASRVFDGKTLTLGGSCAREEGTLVGDLSALLISRTGFWSGWFRAPRMATALIPDFDRKIDAICRECLREPITAFAGVPSWNLLLMRRVLERTGRDNLLEVWPGLELFAHGGVSFAPYRKSFEQLIPSDAMTYMETYNASEGFFALADDPAREDMLLMLDYGTYYEFRQGDRIVPLEGVRCGETYAMLVSSNNGLWRYEIGDTVEFTATDPYRIRFAGRTRQFINVFGEELIVDNAERALGVACEECGAVVEEYSVAPRFMGIATRGAHEWAVEFSLRPASVERFAEVLDRELRRLNSDYDAKRRTALDPPVLRELPAGTALRWLRRRGKNKLPRMRNDRAVVEELLAEAAGGEVSVAEAIHAEV
ncbi:MAG: GH3 auxin-responsive promoter family protein [Alistipes sp.]|nr:GH3 auxin-responsive promoter family protein [Alistipes sp.]